MKSLLLDGLSIIDLNEIRGGFVSSGAGGGCGSDNGSCNSTGGCGGINGNCGNSGGCGGSNGNCSGGGKEIEQNTTKTV